MKHFALLLSVFSVLLVPEQVSAQKKLTILHTNDLHAALLGKNYDNESTGGRGGFARIATQIKTEKAEAGNAVITVDAGDFLMGTLFQMLEFESGFQLNLMQKMGYDAISLGNHEFDYGVSSLKDYLIKAHQLGCPPLLLSNITPKDELAEFYTDSLVRTWQVLEVNGVRVGLFGILGRNAYEYTPNLKDYKWIDPVTAAQKMVKTLREEEQADFVICLSHSGVFKDENNQWKVSEDIELAKKVSGIDAIISGHTHTKLAEPIFINGIPVVQTQTQGMYLGRLNLVQHSPEKTTYTLIPIDGSVKPDPVIDSLISLQFSKLKRNLWDHSGLDYDKIYFETTFPLSFADDIPSETSIGPFLADAMYYAVNAADSAGTDISMIAQGMIRSGLDQGPQDLPSVFRVASLGEGHDPLPGYPLSRLYFTAHEIKIVLELLQVVASGDPGYYCFSGGMQIQYKEKGSFLHRIKAIQLMKKDSSWHTLDCSHKNKTLYSVTADAYMMEFLTVLKKKSFGLVNVKPKLVNGEPVSDFSKTILDFDPDVPGVQEGKVWSCMLGYASSFRDTDRNGIPEVPDRYR